MAEGLLMVAVFPVPREHVEKVWPRVAPLIAQAEQRSGWKAGDAALQVQMGVSLLWVAADGRETLGAAISQLHGKFAYAALLSGVRFAEWRRQIVEQFEAWARLAGCTHCSVDGRRGWDRVLRDHGYTRRGKYLIKELA